MKIGDEVWIHGYVDEIRKDTVIIRNDGGYFGTVKSEISAPPERQKGRWIEHNPHKWGLGCWFECSVCGEQVECEEPNFCPNCGAEMRDSVETARDIVHEAIDNSVWSDTVDTAKIHKVVDDKYAEMTEGEG